MVIAGARGAEECREGRELILAICSYAQGMNIGVCTCVRQAFYEFEICSYTQDRNLNHAKSVEKECDLKLGKLARNCEYSEISLY